MSISWLKAKNDNRSFRFFQNMGFDVWELEDLEKTDETIRELVRKTQRYHCNDKRSGRLFRGYY